MNKESRNKVYILLAVLLFIVVTLCVKYNVFSKKDIIKTACGLSVDRFEQALFSIPEESFDIQFPELRSKFPEFFIDTNLDFKKDVFLDDTLRLVLDSVNMVFKNKLPTIGELEEGFCNYKKYFPYDTFSISTFIDKAFDYRTPVVFANDKLFISLHLFLGSTHSFYDFLPDYIKYSHDTTYLPSSCFVTLAGRHISPPELNNFLDVILHYSKAYFFAKNMLPGISEDKLFKCSSEKMQWCYENESAIWRYMIEQEYLFSTSSKLIDRFVELAPFSQFGLSTDRSSPGSVGVWLGYQIWNSYVLHNDVSLIDVLGETDYMKVLNKSGYKP